MRIGIDCYWLSLRRGIGNYTYHLLRALSETAGDHTFVLYVNGRESLSGVPVDPRFTAKVVGRGLPYPVWEQVSLPLQVMRDRLDVLHCPANTAPLFLAKRTKLIVTIHDVMYLLPASVLPQSPSFYQRLGRFYYRLLAPPAARRARCIMTVSQRSKRDIVDKLRVPQEKVRVIYESGNAQCRPLADSSPVTEVKQRYSIDGQYVFALGAVDPRKNTIGVLRSFAHLGKLTALPIRLVIAGLAPEARSAFHTTISRMNLDGRVVLLGFVSEDELVALYNGAAVFVYPSLYEGFGMPILEAMACGTPVVTSPAGAIPEVAGDAALYVDPHKPEEIAHTILRVISDAGLRARMVEKGLDQAKRFSWLNTARQVMETYGMGAAP